jgi:hypothetical protein
LLSAEAASNATAFNILNQADTANYLLLAVISESAAASSVHFDGQSMLLLESSEAEGTAFIHFYGLPNPSSAGSVQVNFDNTVWGSQVFSYVFLDGVDTAQPLRATAAQTQFHTAATTIPLDFTASIEAGDLVLIASNQEERNATFLISPSQKELFNGNAGATFTAAVAMDVFEASSSSHRVEVQATPSNPDKDRTLAAGIILANVGGVQISEDADGDGIQNQIERYLGSNPFVNEGLDQQRLKPQLLADSAVLGFTQSTATDRPAATIYYSYDLRKWEAFEGDPIQIGHELTHTRNEIYVPRQGHERVFFKIEID